MCKFEPSGLSLAPKTLEKFAERIARLSPVDVSALKLIVRTCNLSSLPYGANTPCKILRGYEQGADNLRTGRYIEHFIKWAIAGISICISDDR